MITARGAEALRKHRAATAPIPGAGQVIAVPGDITTPAGRAAALARLPAGRHPDQQRRRSAAGRLSRLDARRLDQGARRQHADADRADQGHRRRHGRARVRSHRQHHVQRGQGADRRAGPVQRRAQRPHRFCGRPGAADRAGLAQRDDQQPAARRVRHRPHPGTLKGQRRAKTRQVDRGSCRKSAAPPSRPSASARRRSSAQLCAFLCSAQAGYITGQNILLDGGAYPGTY